MSVSIPKPHLPRNRGRWFATLALLVAAAVVVAVVVSNNNNPSRGTGAGTTATGAATVQRRNLVATDTESGTLSYADQQTVYNRLSGTITWVPQVGKVIRAGHALFTVDNKPVLLMNGSTPAYRDLTASDISGPDVYELNRNLVELGYNPDGIVVDDEWQAATTAGVEALQYHLDDTQNGTLKLGQVVFLPGPQMIQTVDTTVGSTAASYTPTAGTRSTEFVDYSSSKANDAGTTGTSTTDTSTTGTTGTTGTTTDTTGTTTTGTGTTTGTSTTGTAGTITTPHTSTTPTTQGKSGASSSGSDNLSHRTLQQLLRLIQEQQRQLQAEEHASRSPSHNSNSSNSNSSNSNSGSHSTGNSGTHGSTGNSGSHGSTGNSGSHGSTGNTGDSGNSGNSGGGSATAVLSTSSTKLVVTVDLSASSQSEATIGEHVTVEMPNGSTAGGRITAVSPVAQSSSSGSGADGTGGGGGGGGSDGSSGSGTSTVPVTIVLNKPAKGGGLDQASVSVNFVQSKARDVLSVPVTALLATSGSTFAVQEAGTPHKLIPVQTGLFAAGYVGISGQGIHPGLQVTDSQG